MATSLASEYSTSNSIEEEYEKTYEKYREILQTLPKGRGWWTRELVLYQGCWLGTNTALKAVMLVQNHFEPRPTDIILSAFMKCGSTWLRALMFAAMSRSRFDLAHHPLCRLGAHACFPFLDSYVSNEYPVPDLDQTLLPCRLFATHMHFSLFPESVRASGCRFVYIWRDPKDVFVSKWHFFNKLRNQTQLPPLSLEEAFEQFCEGVSQYGPFWDHVLGFWRASLESPEKVLLLKYEDLKREPSVNLKRLAKFTGVPFSVEEEEEGVVEQVLELCSFDKLSNLEVNKTGEQKYSAHLVIQNRDFFRKGQVGDCKNYLTEEMMMRLDRITREKFQGTGLLTPDSSTLS